MTTKNKSALSADYRHLMRSEEKPSWFRLLRAYLTCPGFGVAYHYRRERYLERKGRRIRAFLATRRIRSQGADVSVSAEIGPGLRIPHPCGVVIGGKTRIGSRAQIYQGVTLGGSLGKDRGGGWTQPRIGDDVYIGAGAAILGPVSVGNRVVIGANAVVTRDLPDDCVAVGVPARIVRRNGQKIELMVQSDEISETLRKMRDQLAIVNKKLEDMRHES